MSDSPAPAPTVAVQDGPLPGANPAQAIARFFRRYGLFSGRASRSEFWWVYLFLVLSVGVLGGLGTALGYATSTVGPDGERRVGDAVVAAPISILLLLLGVVVPLIAVVVRRLHDADLSGLLALLWLIPYLGGPIVLVLCVLPPRPSGRRFDAAAQRFDAYPLPAAALDDGSGLPESVRIAERIRASVAAGPLDHRATVRRIAAEHRSAPRPYEARTERIPAADGVVEVRYDDQDRVVDVTTI